MRTKRWAGEGQCEVEGEGFGSGSESLGSARRTALQSKEWPAAFTGRATLLANAGFATPAEEGLEGLTLTPVFLRPPAIIM